MYQEAEGAAAAVDACLEAGRRLCTAGAVSALEVVVVDDGSTDATVAEVASLGAPEVRLVEHGQNRGVGAAMRTGFQASNGAVVGYVDADLPVDLAVLGPAVELQQRAGAAVVAVYREGRHHVQLHRRAYSAIWNVLVKTALGLDVRDVNFGFKVFDGRFIRSLPLQCDSGGIDAEILLHARHDGAAVVQLGAPYQPRQTGRSTMSSPTVAVAMLGELVRLRRRIGSGPAER